MHLKLNRSQAATSNCKRAADNRGSGKGDWKSDFNELKYHAVCCGAVNSALGYGTGTPLIRERKGFVQRPHRSKVTEKLYIFGISPSPKPSCTLKIPKSIPGERENGNYSCISIQSICGCSVMYCMYSLVLYVGVGTYCTL